MAGLLVATINPADLEKARFLRWSRFGKMNRMVILEYRPDLHFYIHSNSQPQFFACTKIKQMELLRMPDMKRTEEFTNLMKNLKFDLRITYYKDNFTVVKVEKVIK
jgi:hypothetical protein